MSVMRINRLVRPGRLIPPRRYSTAVQDGEYTATPQYPPILDLSYEKRRERKAEAVHEAIRAVPTVEEKQIKLNMPRFYGFRVYALTEDYAPYNSLGLAQYVTRTHLIVGKALPDYYNNVDVDELARDVKSDVEEAILIEHGGYRRKGGMDGLSKRERDDLIGSALCKQITRIVMSKLAARREDVKNIQVDHDPRIESTWAVGGMNPSKMMRGMKAGAEWSKPLADEPVDRTMVYTGSPVLTVRAEQPLPPIISTGDSENPALEVPFFQYDPRVVVAKVQHRRLTNIPGFWPGDPHQFGLLSFHKRGYLHQREKYQDAEENREALHRQAILSSFSWLHAQANHQGFTTYNDLTYPLVNQAVITDGRSWSFYVYQLNTMLLHSRHATDNPKRNVCWASEEARLFDEVVDGRVVNFNEDVLRSLLRFYANKPEARLGLDLRPYLSDEAKVAADYGDDDKRQWLEREYKFLTSNRPRHKLFPEIYNWEWIYKINNKTRFMEKRRTLQDKLIKPQARTLDDRDPFYIPRKLRPDLPRWKGRYHKEYFP